MNLNKYNLKTRCRAIFVISLGIINNDVIDLDESFFTNLHEFARLKINEDKNKYLPIFSLILPFISSGFKKSFYESEKTINCTAIPVRGCASIGRWRCDDNPRRFYDTSQNRTDKQFPSNICRLEA